VLEVSIRENKLKRALKWSEFKVKRDGKVGEYVVAKKLSVRRKSFFTILRLRKVLMTFICLYHAKVARKKRAAAVRWAGHALVVSLTKFLKRTYGKVSVDERNGKRIRSVLAFRGFLANDVGHFTGQKIVK
jgi:hypothetical protein